MLDLLSVLDRNRGGIDNTIVYGYVSTAINKPYYLPNNLIVTEKGFFAKVDVLAIKCTKQDYFKSNEQEPQSVYIVHGDLVVYMTDSSLIGKNVKIMGSNQKRTGKVKRQFGSESAFDGITAFVWEKVSGGWGISPNYVVPLCSNDVKGTVMEEFVISASNTKGFVHPAVAEAYKPFKGVIDEKLEEIQPAIESKTSNSVESVLPKKQTKIVFNDNGLVDLSKIDLGLRHQLEVSLDERIVDITKAELEELKEKSVEFTGNLVSSIKERASDKESRIKLSELASGLSYAFINEVVKEYNTKLTRRYKYKGSVFVDKFVDSIASNLFGVGVEKEDRGTFLAEIDDIRRSVSYDHTVLDPASVKVVTLKDERVFSLFVIGTITGIGVDTLNSCYNAMSIFNDLSDIDYFHWCVFNNPYYLGLMGNLSLYDCDILQTFFCLNKYAYTDDIKQARGYLRVINAFTELSGRNTISNRSRDILHSRSDVSRQAGKNLTKEYASFKENRHFLSSDYFDIVEIVLGDVEKAYEDSESIIKMRYSSNKAIKELLESGVITLFGENVLILQTDLHKEFTILETLIKKGQEQTSITDKNIDETVKVFEQERKFKLEKLQKDGIKLIQYKSGVLSGCAGSGKTTTSDCMVMGIKEYMRDVELKFAAPTGKAAKRLSEVVGGNVRTIHSLFGIGLDSEPSLKLNSYGRRTKMIEGSPIAYFLDEMAMCNTSLLYNVVTKLREKDMIYFLGDIKQLPPIGTGSPFKALMQLLPCVELGVSKRAAEGSKINYNCGLINFLSDEEKLIELTAGEDFEILPCKDEQIQKHVVDVFKSYLMRFPEDDIQVITGYRTEEHSHSTECLNPLLQRILRQQHERLYVYNNKEFMLNDRVIHIKRNAYEVPRFRKKMDGFSHLEEVVTFGVTNGDLGKIVGMIRSDKVTIDPWYDPEHTAEDLKGMDERYVDAYQKRINTQVEIRKEHEFNDEKIAYVIVEVFDTDLQENVYLLYRGMEKKAINTDFAVALSGFDMSYLDLAYALTTHKMQGSQSKAVIIPLSSKGSASFINRNMINTMITRASEQVCLIGSVEGAGSALEAGRRITSVDSGRDLLSEIVVANESMKE
jgi:ATP-dependent exoDNAse (exonuclease V) alpha subunit